MLSVQWAVEGRRNCRPAECCRAAASHKGSLVEEPQQRVLTQQRRVWRIRGLAACCYCYCYCYCPPGRKTGGRPVLAAVVVAAWKKQTKK